MTCGEVVCKSISGIFTFVFTLASLAIMGFSGFVAFFIIVTSSPDTMAKYYTVVPSLVTFVLAAILIVSIILACCAMCQNSICCLDTYSIILIILAVANIGVGVFTLVYFRGDVTGLRSAISRDVQDAMEGKSDDIDSIQEFADCCGTLGPGSYDLLHTFNNPGVNIFQRDRELPRSCCDDDVPCRKNSPSVHPEGCVANLLGYILVFNYIIGWAAVIVGISEYSIILIILAVANIGVGVFTLVYFRGDVTGLRSAISRDVQDAMEGKSDDIDSIQEFADCCGTLGPGSYDLLHTFNNPGVNIFQRDRELPRSCCDDDVPCRKNSPSVHPEGCVANLLGYILVFNYIIGWAAVIVGISEYAIILTLLAIGNIIIGVFTLLRFTWNYQELNGAIAIDTVNAMSRYPVDPTLMDMIQYMGRCCGTDGPSSYLKYEQWRDSFSSVHPSLPRSCCANDLPACTMDAEEVYKDGCIYTTFAYNIVLNMVVGWMALIIGVAEHAGFLVVLGLCHLGIGTFCYLKYRNVNLELATQIYNDMEHMVNKYMVDPEPMDRVQFWLSCCGVTSYDDWKWANSTYPESCCKTNNDGIRCSAKSPYLNVDGCSAQAYNSIAGFNHILGYASFALGGAEVIGALYSILMSCCLWRRKSDTESPP